MPSWWRTEFEQAELVEPKKALDDAGAKSQIVSPAKGQVHAWKHFDKADKFPVDVALENANAESFDALLTPPTISASLRVGHAQCGG